MATIYHDADIDRSVLEDRTVAVIGFGSQGHAQALNLRDSGVDVLVGLRPGSGSRSKAEAEGLRVMTIEEAAAQADVVALLVPDETMSGVYEEAIASGLDPGDALLFAHGFNIHYGQIEPPESIDVVMAAPKGPGHLLRRTYEEGSGVPCLVAVHQDASGNALGLALGYAAAIGGGRAGILETSFEEETETDLFGEQVVLVGGVSELIKASYETLVDAGYQPESAYFETLHELKLIVDLLYEGGLGWMNHSISNTAEYGGYTRGARIIDADTRDRMRAILADIRSGAFATEWLAQAREGSPVLEEGRARMEGHQIESTGSRLRELMPFLHRPQ